MANYLDEELDPTEVQGVPQPTGQIIQQAALQQAPDQAPAPAQGVDAFARGVTPQAPTETATALNPAVSDAVDSQSYAPATIDQPDVWRHAYQDPELDARAQQRDYQTAETQRRQQQSEENKRAAKVVSGLKSSGVEMETDPTTGAQAPKRDAAGRILYKPETISPLEERAPGEFVTVKRNRFGENVEVPVKPRIDPQTGEKFVIDEDGVSRRSLGIDQQFLARRDTHFAAQQLDTFRKQHAANKQEEKSLTDQLKALATEAAQANGDPVKLARIGTDRTRIQAEIKALQSARPALEQSVTEANKVYLANRDKVMAAGVDKLAQDNPGAALSLAEGKAPVSVAVPDTTQPPGLDQFMAAPTFKAATTDQRVDALKTWVDQQAAWQKANVPGFDEKAFRGQFPDRGGFFGALSELGHGIWTALTDEFPEDIARIARGGDVTLKGDRWYDQWIAEQEADKRARGQSLQNLAGSGLANSLATGPSSIATSMVTSVAGGSSGAVAGTAVAPGVGTAIGAMIGAGTASGAAFYRMTKDQFVEQLRDKLVADHPDMTEAQWQTILNQPGVQSDAKTYGLWEAGPEAVASALTTWIFPGITKVFGSGEAAAVKEIAKRSALHTIGKYGLKMGAEVGEELGTETVSQKKEGEIEAKYGLRNGAPTWGDAFKEIAGPTIVGALLQGGGMSIYEHIKEAREHARIAEETAAEGKDNEAVAAKVNEAGKDTPDFAPITAEDVPAMQAAHRAAFTPEDSASLAETDDTTMQLVVQHQAAVDAGDTATADQLATELNQHIADNAEVGQRSKTRNAEVQAAVDEMRKESDLKKRAILSGALNAESGSPMRGSEQRALMGARTPKGKPYAEVVKTKEGKRIRLTQAGREAIQASHPAVAKLFNAKPVTGTNKGAPNATRQTNPGGPPGSVPAQQQNQTQAQGQKAPGGPSPAGSNPAANGQQSAALILTPAQQPSVKTEAGPGGTATTEAAPAPAVGGPLNRAEQNELAAYAAGLGPTGGADYNRERHMELQARVDKFGTEGAPRRQEATAADPTKSTPPPETAPVPPTTTTTEDQKTPEASTGDVEQQAPAKNEPAKVEIKPLLTKILTTEGLKKTLARMKWSFEPGESPEGMHAAIFSNNTIGLVFNEERIVERMAERKDGETAEAFVRKMIDEEITHLASLEAVKREWKARKTKGPDGKPESFKSAWDREGSKVAAELETAKLPDGRTYAQFVRDTYGDPNLAGANLTAEFVRQLSQMERTQLPTEGFLRKFADKILAVLRDLLGTKEQWSAGLRKLYDRTNEVYQEATGPPKEKANAEPEKRASTQVTLTPDDAAKILKVTQAIPESDIYSEKDEKGKEDFGRELEPHITALFGLTKEVTADDVRRVMGELGLKEITAKLGKLSLFENADKPYDVLKVSVNSPDLHKVNAALKGLPFTSDYPDYTPHLTIAYLRKGMGAKYKGGTQFDGLKLTFPELTFSSATREHTIIALGEKPAGNEPAPKPAPTEKAAETSAAPKIESTLDEATQQDMRDAFGGLSAPPESPITQTQVGLPAEKLPAFISLASKLVAAGVKTAEALAREIHAVIGERGHKYSQALWNAISSVEPDLMGKHPWTDIYRSLDAAQSGGTATPEEAKAEAPSSPRRQTAEEVASLLRAGRVITWRDLFAIADKAWGGTQAEGKYTVKDAYDAMELGVNLRIRELGLTPDGSVIMAQNAIGRIEHNILDFLPTQSKRTAEQDAMQQFSTPPQLAFAAAWVANIRPGDVLLEPSAGIGGLAVFGKNAGAIVITNELSDRRRVFLSQMGFDHVTGENAEQLHAILEPRIASGELPQPTVVVMNPPFSNAAKSGVKGRTIIGAQHVEEALKLLPEGGRLVAIVGDGMSMEAPTFRPWWNKILQKYTVRANVAMDGKNYAKYGTSFDNRLLVIDKTGPTRDPSAIVKAKVASITELPNLLKGVRDERAQSSNPASGGSPATESGSTLPEGSGKPAATTGALGGGITNPATADGPVGSGESGRPTGDQPGTGGTSPSVDQPGNRPNADGVDRPGAEGSGTASAVSPAPGNGEQRVSEVERDTAADHKPVENEGEVFAVYTPSKARIKGAQKHPAPLVESSAMAAVELPDPTYTPNLPREVVTEGKLSDVQLESVIYAGQAHAQQLPNGDRRGFFIGDGTGVGKGRQIAGIILDNQRQGRKKAVWLSKSAGLINDARRDAADLGIDPKTVVDWSKTKREGVIQVKDGIIFGSYTLLSGRHTGIMEALGDWWRKITGRGTPESRVEQLAKWLGKDFDGVLMLDEAHRAGNAIAIKGKRGIKKPSLTGVSVVDLQRALPNARVVYVSATGATEVENLSYADRLGIWGDGTSFSTKQQFFEKIGAGGISAMEVVARDLKAQGSYIARSISYRGVQFDRLTQSLTPEQRKTYDTIATGWQSVLSNLDDTLANTGATNSAQARSSALSAFWGAQQRFFNQLLTALEMPALLGDMRKEMAAGKSLVLQLVNTNEATQKRALANRLTETPESEDAAPLEDLDLSPRDILLQYINTSFPTVKYEEISDPNDPEKTVWQPAKDAAGNMVQDPEAVAAKNRLLDNVALLEIPENPLEQILNAFGEENVAEVTGRTQRVVQALDENGNRKAKLQNRSVSNRKVEADQFQEGRRQVLIFSDAGGTGFSFHASLKAKNQSLRVHYLVQAGWRADNALQGFGRTHRSNQKQPPHYKLVETDIPGHKRFISTIARRLQQLGALTTGERKSTGQGMFDENDNLESNYAADALRRLIYDLHSQREPSMTMQEFANLLGFTKTTVDRVTGERETRNTLVDPKTGALIEEKMPPVPQFLNRILAAPLDKQTQLFNLFSDRLQTRIENAKRDGTYDPGTQTYKADSLKVKSDDVVFESPDTTAKTRIVGIEESNKVVFTTFDQAEKIMGDDLKGFVKNIRSGKIYALKDAKRRTLEDGRIVEMTRRFGPLNTDDQPAADIRTAGEDANYESLTPAEARAAWEAEIEGSDKERKSQVHFLVGAMLPIWDRVQLGSPKIYRVTTDDEKSMLGVLIPEKEVVGLRSRLGAKSNITPESAHHMILEDGSRMTLANGWKLKRSLVSGEHRIEITGLSFGDMHEWNGYMGGITERINFQPRFFVSTEAAAGQETMRKLLAKSPIAEVNGSALSAPPESAPNEGEMPSTKEAKKTVREAMASALAEMPAKERDVLTRSMRGESIEDVAKAVGLTAPGAEQAYRMALAKLRKSRQAAEGIGAIYSEAMREPKGQRTIGRPELANPARGEASRRLVDSADKIRKDADIPSVKADTETQAEADVQWQALGSDGVRKALVKKAREGGQLSDAETLNAKRLVRNMALTAVRQKDENSMVEAAMLIDAYRQTGTEQARAFRQRRDAVKTPAQRFAEYLGEAILTPDTKRKKALEKADKEKDLAKREAILRDWAKQIEKLKAKLKKLGVDLDNLDESGVRVLSKDRVKAAATMRAVATAKSDYWDAAYEYWIASILSGPATNVANITGNVANAVWDFGPQRFTEALVNLFVRDKGSASFGEFGRMIKGFIPGWKRASRNMVQSWRTEGPVFEGDVLNEPGESKLEGRTAAIGGKKGRIIRAPLRLLGAADDFSKSLVGTMQVQAEAYRIANGEGLSGDAMEKRIALLTMTPTEAVAAYRGRVTDTAEVEARAKALAGTNDALFQDKTSDEWEQARNEAALKLADADGYSTLAWERAKDKAVELAFQEELGPIGKLLLLGRKNVPGLRYIIPFVTTLSNIVKVGIRKSPLGSVALAYRAVRSGFVKMGWDNSGWHYTRTLAVKHVAEQLLAFGFLMGLAGLAAPGGDDDIPTITGTMPYQPGNRGDRDLAQRTAPAQSIRIGGRWYSYARIEPFATALSYTVDLLNRIDRSKKGEDTSATLGEAFDHITAQLKDKTFARGISDVLNATADGASATKWAGNFSTSWVPNIVRQTAKESDATVREQAVWGTGQEWRDREIQRLGWQALPTAGNAPEPKVDLWGREIVKDGGPIPGADVLWRILSPARTQKVDVTSLDRLILNWNNTNPNETFAPVPPRPYFTVRKESGKSDTIPMTDKQYHDFLAMAGKDAAGQLQSSGLNYDHPTADDIKAIKKTLATSRKTAREAIWEQRVYSTK